MTDDPQLRHNARVTTYRIAEAAALLGVSDDTVRRHTACGSPEWMPTEA